MRTIYHVWRTERERDVIVPLSMWQLKEKYGSLKDKSQFNVIVYEGEIGSQCYTEKNKTTLDMILK